MSERRSMMRLHTYRLTATGERVEVSSSEVVEDMPELPITSNWPTCRCPRCPAAVELPVGSG